MLHNQGAIDMNYQIMKLDPRNRTQASERSEQISFGSRLSELFRKSILFALTIALMLLPLSTNATFALKADATATGTAGGASSDASSGVNSASSGAESSASPSSDAAGSSAAGANSTDSGSANSTTKIKAGVQMIELNLQVLRDVGLDIKNIIKAASSLYDEVTIQPVTLMTEPEVVGMGTIINIPIGFTPTGAGPQPSKKRVDLAMAQMRPIIEIMKGDVDDFESGRKRLDISNTERAELKPLLDDWVELVNGISTKLTSLEGITKAPPYDNNAIASLAGDIHKDCKKMDEVRRKLYKALQKAGKRKSKNA